MATVYRRHHIQESIGKHEEFVYECVKGKNSECAKRPNGCYCEMRIAYWDLPPTHRKKIFKVLECCCTQQFSDVANDIDELPNYCFGDPHIQLAASEKVVVCSYEILWCQAVIESVLASEGKLVTLDYQGHTLRETEYICSGVCEISVEHTCVLQSHHIKRAR